ncbi:MAG: InlB B-repeat-containing protein, partial [Candidatus Coproplasma sp.]
YTGAINILPIGVSTIKNIPEEKINIIDSSGNYFMETSGGDVIITANVTYTVVLKNAQLDERFYETSSITAEDSGVTVAENAYNGYDIVQTFKAGAGEFKQIIAKAKDGYLLPEYFVEQSGIEDPYLLAYGYQGLKLTRSGSSLFINCSGWSGNTAITATVEATVPADGDVVCDGVKFTTPINQEGACNQDNLYTGSWGGSYTGSEGTISILNFEVISTMSLYLEENVVMYTHGSVGENCDYSAFSPENITVDLYLNGHTLTLYGYGGDEGITVYPNATFNIYDSEEGNGKIVFQSSDESYYNTGIIDSSCVLSVKGGTVNMYGGTISSYFNAVKLTTSSKYTQTTSQDEFDNTIYTNTYSPTTFRMFGGALSIQYTKYTTAFVAALYAAQEMDYVENTVYNFAAHDIKIYGDSKLTGVISNAQDMDLNFDAYGFIGDAISVRAQKAREGEVLCRNTTANKINFTNKGYTAIDDAENEGYVIVKPAMEINLSSDEHGWFSNGSESGITSFGVLQGKTLAEAGLQLVTDAGYEAKEFIYQAIIVGVAAGDDFTIILLSDGSLWACGGNEYGQLGNKSYEGSSAFVPMQTESGAITGVSAVYAKGHMAVAVMKDKSTMACGDNTYGQLGVNSSETKVNYFMPMVDADGNKLSGATRAYMSGNHTFVVNYVAEMGKYELYACGKNDHGQLGIGSAENNNVLIGLTVGEYVSDYISIECGEDFTVFNVYKQNGGDLIVYMAGSNYFLKTLNGPIYKQNDWNTQDINLLIDTSAQVDYTTPTQLFEFPYQFVQLRVGGGFVIAFVYSIDAEYKVLAMGDNSKGQCANYSGDTYVSTFSPMYDANYNEITGVREIYVGKDFVVAFKFDGSVWVCGNNENGQLGINRSEPYINVFTQVAQSLDNYSKWAVGGSHLVALKSDGSLYVSGSNAAGQLGLSSSTAQKNALTERVLTEAQLTANSLADITANYNMNLRAVTGLLEFDINLIANTGDAADDKVEKTQLHKLYVKDLPVPEWDEFHTFVGWFTEAEGGEAVTDQTLTEDITIYAHWTLNYKITLDAKGGTVSPSYLVTKDGKLTSLPNAKYDSSHLFFAWYTEENGGGEEVTLDTVFTADATIYASYITVGKTIDRIEKTTEGLVDTYTIYYTDDTTYSFTVTNGTGGSGGSGSGADGNGIEKIELTKTEGNVDTYKITFTDKTTFNFTVTNGTNGADGADGKKLEMQINAETNMWEYRYEGDSEWVSTGVKATGSDGADGRGIVKIEKTATVGLVDTYTIYYSDDTTSTFTVTNGQNGGENGITPHIGENGNWYIGETDTGVKAVGTDGATGATGAAGADGADGREILIRINSETNEWEYKYEGDENWTSLGVKATGSDGADGRGIVKI